MVIHRAALGRLDRIGAGGFGIVYKATASLNGGPAEAVAYKELLPPRSKRKGADVEWNRRSIRESIHFRDSLSEHDRQQLDGMAVWPLELVVERQRVVGYVMRLIDERFWLQTKDAPALASLGFLAAKDATLAASGIDAVPFRHFAVRLSLVTQLAYAVAWLHRRGRIFGDLSLTNGVFIAHPTQFLLMDCDATARPDDPHRRQANSPYFHPPERGKLQTFASDVYKLALCVVRALSSGRGATQVTTTKRLQHPVSHQLRSLLDSALSPKPEERPTARQLWEALSHHLEHAYPAPRFESVTSSPPGPVLRGQDVVVRWVCDKADSVTVTGPDGTSVTAAPAAGYATIRITRAGDIRIKASNNHGETEATVREVQVYELGLDLGLDGIPLPRVQLPKGLSPQARMPRVNGPIRPQGLPRLTARPQEGSVLGQQLHEVGSTIAGLQRSATRQLHAQHADLRERLWRGLEEHRKATASAVRTLAAEHASGAAREVTREDENAKAEQD